ncbi:MAG: LacI family DNA-binding transcriptional regulator [Eubacteriales bacterium]|nr:LacI family DNA-binding transcriptional regulator [Eubacteriales bacterium]
MKPTIKDVARLAQVSPSTVSRALRDNARISEEMRRRVQQIARELDFHPNQMARGLVNRQTRIVGVLLPGPAALSFAHPFFTAILQVLGEVAARRHYHMLLATGDEQRSEPEALRDMAESGYVSGMLCLATHRCGAPLITDGLPLVELGHPRMGEGSYSVDNDNVAAGYAAARHLLDHGHERMLFLGHDEQVFVTLDRLTGCHKALSERGIQPRPDWIISNHFLENPAEMEQLERIFAAPDRPTAVVSMDTPLSIGLIGCLSGWGLTVPADTSLVSFNDSPAGRYYSPALTTIDVGPRELGEKAMELLLDLVEGKAGPPTHLISPFTLIERDSVRKI